MQTVPDQNPSEPTSQSDGAARLAMSTEVVSVITSCERCTSPFSYTPILFNGKEVAKQRWCSSCVEADQDRIRKLDRRQGDYSTALQESDRETGLRQLMADAGVNAWEHGCSSFDNFDVGESTFRPVEYARQFAEAVLGAKKFTPIRGFYLWGETGCGKTHLAVAVVRHLIQGDYLAQRILFDHAAQLIARIQDTYGRKEASTMDVLEKRFDAGLWVLDDLGTERATDDVVRHLNVIFAERAMKPTLITSNFSPARLEAERPELMRVLSRLGPKYFRVCEVKGRDRRFD